MKRFLIVLCLASAIPASSAVAAGPYPWWFHTRPKTVLLEDQPTTPADARNRTPGHGMAAWPNWGRTNIVDDRRERQAQPKSWLADFFARGWRAGAQRSK
jgi:hypothetical protein